MSRETLFRESLVDLAEQQLNYAASTPVSSRRHASCHSSPSMNGV